jgi:mRNA-degrading endonuclease toxin of MazEF toxin-antitoxin module
VALGPEDGMPQRCFLTLDNLTLMRKAYFVERICHLGPARMHAVCAALRVATDC